MAGSSNFNSLVPFPKPPSPEPPSFSEPSMPVAVVPDDILVVSPSSDPPPPYRAPRRSRGATRNSRRVLQASEDSQLSAQNYGSEYEDGDDHEATERSPLLRRRTLSHSSTTHSVNSLAHTVMSSSRTVMALFQTEEYEYGAEAASMVEVPFTARTRRYFRPLVKRKYYAALFHLLVINLPYEILVWVYLFVGTLTGTTLLITLPLGAIICFIDILGARMFARGEIALQARFHGPLTINPPQPPHPIFSRYRSLPTRTDSFQEDGTVPPPLVKETSFLRLSYLMFTDPKSYQALFYFLVIKPGVTLIIFLVTLIFVPPAFVLVFPAPAVLRAIRRIGIWQAEVAIDALS